MDKHTYQERLAKDGLPQDIPTTSEAEREQETLAERMDRQIIADHLSDDHGQGEADLTGREL